MRRNVVGLMGAILLLAVCPAVRGDLIANWTFETNTPANLTDVASQTGLSPDTGSGTAGGVHASALTDWTTPPGNGSAESFNSNRWAIGDYYEFSVATTGFEDIQVSWDQARSSQGPTTFDFSYSVNGGAFVTALDDYSVLISETSAGPPATEPWDALTPRQSAFTFTVDLSSALTLNNAANVAFRLTGVSTPSSANGTVRVDNFLVEGTAIVAVPEASSFVFGGAICTVAGLWSWRQRRRRDAALA
jgi:hypothetical protein